MSDTETNTSDFIRTVSVYIDRSGLIAEGSRVVLGVSGGPDSVAMTEALCLLAPQRRWELHVAHLDHGLRSESGQDAQWVSQLARRLGLTCHQRREDIARISARESMGIEETSRRARYAFLRQTARQVQASHVAVAHHRDDQVETVLQRLFRGTHLRGLEGMRPRRRLGPGVALVRPLLGVSREQILGWLGARRIGFRQDPTNRQTRFDRNFIRCELLPLLRDRLNPRVDEAVARVAQAAGKADAYLRRQARRHLATATVAASDRELELDARQLSRLDPAVLGVCIRLMFERLGQGLKDISTEHFRRIEGMILSCESASTLLPGKVQVTCSDSRLTLRVVEQIPDELPSSEALLKVPGEVQWGGLNIDCRLLKPEHPEALPGWKPPEMTSEVLDYGAIRGNLTVRPRREGDAFVPLGAPGTQNVGDFLTNVKASPRLRRRVLCICDAQGIVYLCPFRIAQRVRLTDQTRKVLRISVR